MRPWIGVIRSYFFRLAIAGLGVAVIAGEAPGQSPSAKGGAHEEIGIATGLPNQVYHAVGQGLSAVLKDRMHILLDKPEGTYTFEVVTSELGSIESAKQIAAEGKSKVRCEKSPGNADNDKESLIFDDGGSKEIMVRLGLINSFAIEPIKNKKGGSSPKRVGNFGPFFIKRTRCCCCC